MFVVEMDDVLRKNTHQRHTHLPLPPHLPLDSALEARRPHELSQSLPRQLDTLSHLLHLARSHSLPLTLNHSASVRRVVVHHQILSHDHHGLRCAIAESLDQLEHQIGNHIPHRFHIRFVLIVTDKLVRLVRPSFILFLYV